jgi:hypothetical protein
VLPEGGCHSLPNVFGEGGGSARLILILIEFRQAILAGATDEIQLLLELSAGRADPSVDPRRSGGPRRNNFHKESRRSKPRDANRECSSQFIIQRGIRVHALTAAQRVLVLGMCKRMP